MSNRYFQVCPVSKAAEILGERWTILIIRELLLGAPHFGDLQHALPRLSPTLLTKRLHELQDVGIVIRKTGSGGRRTEYQLTAAGRELEPVILKLGEWGMKWARGQMSDDELDVESLMYDYNRRLDPTQLPSGETVLEFVFNGLRQYGRWWIVVAADGERELCIDPPGRPVDLQIRSDLRTLTEIWTGDTDLRAARREGRLELTGNAVLIRTIRSWLRTSIMAHIRPHPKALRV